MTKNARQPQGYLSKRQSYIFVWYCLTPFLWPTWYHLRGGETFDLVWFNSFMLKLYPRIFFPVCKYYVLVKIVKRTICSRSAPQHKHIVTKVTRKRRWWEEGQKEKPAGKRQKDCFTAGLPGWRQCGWEKLIDLFPKRLKWNILCCGLWLNRIIFRTLYLLAEHLSRKQEREVSNFFFC